MQSRHTLPGWFGLGNALDEYLGEDPEGLERLREMYRRWPFWSTLIDNAQMILAKADLVIDAVACMKKGDIDFDALPDTGTLRGDLVAMMKPHTIVDAEKKLQIMAGLVSMLAKNPELTDAVNAAIVEPRASLNRIFLRRAVERGEIPDDADIEKLALIAPAMASYRVLIQRRPVDREFLLSVMDDILLPAVGIRRTSTPR